MIATVHNRLPYTHNINTINGERKRNRNFGGKLIYRDWPCLLNKTFNIIAFLSNLRIFVHYCCYCCCCCFCCYCQKKISLDFWHRDKWTDNNNYNINRFCLPALAESLSSSNRNCQSWIWPEPVNRNEIKNQMLPYVIVRINWFFFRFNSMSIVLNWQPIKQHGLHVM